MGCFSAKASAPGAKDPDFLALLRKRDYHKSHTMSLPVFSSFLMLSLTMGVCEQSTLRCYDIVKPRSDQTSPHMLIIDKVLTLHHRAPKDPIPSRNGISICGWCSSEDHQA